MSALRWPTVRDLRLSSGLVLFTYIAAHLINHALGLGSLALAERGLWIATTVWHSLPGTVILYSAAGIHLTLALLAIARRRTWRMPPIELVRIVAGLMVPSLLIGHFIGTRLATDLSGHRVDYQTVVGQLLTSGSSGLQIALLAPGWVHGCLGLHLAFSRRPWMRRFPLVWFAAALLLPTLSAVGFVSMSKELAARQALAAALQPKEAAPTLVDSYGYGLPNKVTAQTAEEVEAHSDTIRTRARLGYALLIAFAALTPLVRFLIDKQRGNLVLIRYPGRNVHVPRGWSVLEASRSHNIAHVSVCGGRARCSTCRVRVLDGLAACPPPGDDEARTLQRIKAPPDVRLACQLRPVAAITIVPELNPATFDKRAGPGTPVLSKGIERHLVLINVELHDPTTSGACLPGDLSYLAQTFVDTAVASARLEGGYVVSRQADTLLIAFGLHVGSAESARHALNATLALSRQLRSVAGRLSLELSSSFHYRVDVHAGTAVVITANADAIDPDAEADSSLQVIGPVVEQMRQLRIAIPRVDTERVLITEAVLEACGAPRAPAPGLFGPGFESARKVELLLRGDERPKAVWLAADPEALIDALNAVVQTGTVTA